MIILPLYPHISLMMSLILPFLLYCLWKWGKKHIRIADPAQHCLALWLLNLLPFCTLFIVGIETHRSLDTWKEWIQVGIGPLQSPRLHAYLLHSLPRPPQMLAADKPATLLMLPVVILIITRQAGLIYGFLMGGIEYIQSVYCLRHLPQRKEGDVIVLSITGFTAFTFGLARPHVYVTEAVWLSPHRDAVLAHERAHVRRHDPLLRFAAIWVRRILWYLPGWKQLTDQIEFEAERACDTLACEQVGRAAYARALLAFTDQPTCRVLMKPAMALAFPSAEARLDGETGLLARARALMEGEPSPTPRLFWPLFLLFFAFTAIFA